MGDTRDRAERPFLHLAGGSGAISVSLRADTHRLAPADIEKFLLTMEAVLVDAAAAGPGPA